MQRQCHAKDPDTVQRQCHAKDNVMLKTPKQNTFAKDRCACELQLAAVGATALRAGSPQGSPTLPSRGHIVPRLKGQTSGGLLLDLPGGLCQLEFACAPSANCMLHREASEQVLKTSTCAVDPLSCLHVSLVSLQPGYGWSPPGHGGFPEAPLETEHHTKPLRCRARVPPDPCCESRAGPKVNRQYVRFRVPVGVSLGATRCGCPVEGGQIT